MCTNCVPKIDATKADAFAERMIQMLNDAGTAMMTSIGHRTGLFDAMAQLPPSTCHQIAVKARLNERYVREWLGAMTTARLVQHDPKAQTYALPAEHAAYLTRDGSEENIAQTLQWISVLGSVEDEITESFKRGGGVPYSSYKRFHEVMADESDQTVVAGLDEQILPLVPDMKRRLEEGIDVLDVGCGSGHAMIHLAGCYPNSTFVGYDISEEAIGNARRIVEAKGLTNVRFEIQDAAAFDDTDVFDLICVFDAVHDQARPAAMLANIARALKPGGVFLMQDIQGTSSHHGDIGHPIAPFIYTVSCMHCMSVSLAAGGAGLGAAWGKKTALDMLNDAGFRKVDVKELEHDFINYYYIARAA